MRTYILSILPYRMRAIAPCLWISNPLFDSLLWVPPSPAIISCVQNYYLIDFLCFADITSTTALNCRVSSLHCTIYIRAYYKGVDSKGLNLLLQHTENLPPADIAMMAQVTIQFYSSNASSLFFIKIAYFLSTEMVWKANGPALDHILILAEEEGSYWRSWNMATVVFLCQWSGWFCWSTCS